MVTLGSENLGEHESVFRALKCWNKGEGVDLFALIPRAKPSSVRRHGGEVGHWLKKGTIRLVIPGKCFLVKVLKCIEKFWKCPSHHPAICRGILFGKWFKTDDLDGRTGDHSVL